MIQKYWYLPQIWNLKAGKQVPTQSYYSSNFLLTSQSIQNRYCTSLTKSTHKYSLINISFYFLTFPKLCLFFNFFIQSLQTLSHLFQATSFLLILLIARSKNFDVVPAWAFHPTINCNRPHWGLQKFNSSSLMQWRFRYLKKIKKSRRSIAQPMKPNQRKQGFLQIKNNSSINLIQYLKRILHYQLITNTKSTFPKIINIKYHQLMQLNLRFLKLAPILSPNYTIS